MNSRKGMFEDFPPYLQLMLFALFVFVILILTMLAGVAIALPFSGKEILNAFQGDTDLMDPANVGMLKYLQIVSQIGWFLLPPLLFAWAISRKPLGYLRLKISPNLASLFFGGLAILAVTPFVGWLAQINASLDLPEYLQGVENWMRRSEQQAGELTQTFLTASTWSGFLVNLLMLAVLPAIGEEMFFRGVLLRVFKDWTKNNHLAVMISAVLFSALHLQFFGFLPRLFLGIFLGYLFVWSGKLWLPIFVHFVNNGFAVLVMFFYRDELQGQDLESIGTSKHSWVVIGSLLVFCLLMFAFYENEKRLARLRE